MLLTEETAQSFIISQPKLYESYKVIIYISAYFSTTQNSLLSNHIKFIYL